MFKTDLEHIKPYYPQYSDEQIQTLIAAANRFEEQRKAFVQSIVFREKTKKK